MPPRLLDLFCGAGGAAVGYHRAGFEITGVDNMPQPHYPFRFCQADAITFPLSGFDLIHASPPCQTYSRATCWTGDQLDHPDLIGIIRNRILATNTEYVIENVHDAKRWLIAPILLCGSMFDLKVRRHRYFETSLWISTPGPCNHHGLMSFDHGGKVSEAKYRDAMQCTWMTAHEARDAIPPAYTEYIGNKIGAYMQL